jgi:hypothetical protein
MKVFGQCLVMIIIQCVKLAPGTPPDDAIGKVPKISGRLFCSGRECNTNSGHGGYHSEKMQYYANLHSSKRKHGVELPTQKPYMTSTQRSNNDLRGKKGWMAT